MYLSAVPEIVRPVRPSASGHAAAAPLTPKPRGPNFKFECQAGCGRFPPGICQTILRQAILDAIKLAENAARLLEADRRSITTINEFQAIFGYEPSRPLPWPQVKDFGIRVAYRYRAVARALRKGGTLYRCHPCPPSAASEYPNAVVDANAWALLDRAGAAQPPNEVWLCPSFWLLTPPLQAGVILHEMFHLRYDPCYVHGTCETKRTNAHCYEALALRLAKFNPDMADIARCQTSPH
jgi:hypothetical protein